MEHAVRRPCKHARDNAEKFFTGGDPIHVPPSLAHLHNIEMLTRMLEDKQIEEAGRAWRTIDNLRGQL